MSSATAGLAGRGGDGRRLQPGVALQRVGVLDDVGHVGRPRQQLDGVAEDRRDLGDLVRVGRGADERQHRVAQRRGGGGTDDHLGLQVGDLGQPELGQHEQLVELAARERHPLGRALDLDEARLAAGRPVAA